MDAISTSVPSLASGVFYVLLGLGAAGLAIYYHLTTMKMVRLGNLIPGPPTMPFVGNAFEFTGIPPSRMVAKLMEYEKYGPVIRAFVARKLLVFLLNPEDIEIILSSHVHIDKSPEYRFFKPWLGDGLLISSGQKWRAHRKMIAPTFHLNILKTFVPVFNENSASIVKQLRKEIGKEFDCHDYLSGVTVKILLETAMGIRKTDDNKNGFDYAFAVMEMCDIIHQRQYNLHLRFDSIFKFTDFGRRQKKLLEIIHGFTSRVITQRKQSSSTDSMLEKSPNDADLSAKKKHEREEKEPEARTEKAATMKRIEGTKYVRDDLDEIDETDIGEKKRLAFLDLMLETSRNGANLTDADIKEQVDTIMFEGHDTTAAGSSFVLCVLGIHQNIQARVVEELDEIFKGSDRPATYDDTLEMKYLERVILETLRLFPPVPAIARNLTEDVRIVTGGYVLPAGTTVIVPTFQVHRHEKFYENPKSFDPDHFLPEKTQQRHYYSYIPFSAGPRSCVGRKYAMLKLKILLSTILRSYEILSDLTEEDFQLRVDIILKRTDGFRIRIKPRS